MKNWLKSFVIFTLISTITLGGCQNINANSSSENKNLNPTQTTITADNSSINMNLPTLRLEGKATVVMTVKAKPITIEIDGNNAPITAGNFVDLVQRGVYDGLVFHRVVKEPQPFVAQGGDPQGKNRDFPVGNLGSGGFTDPETKSQRYIPLEIQPEYKEGEKPPAIIYSKPTDKIPQLKHTRGAIAMARSQMPDSASSQFYFALADLPFLDGDYAVFGYVTNGMEVVDNIKQGDRIDSAKVISGIENLKK